MPDEAEAHAVVAVEIGRHQRRAMRLEKGRRGDHHHPALPELARHQPRFAKRTGADGNVGPFSHQVDDAVGERQIDGNFRVAFEESRQQRDQPVHAERHKGVDAQPAARCGTFRRLALGRRDLGEDAQSAVVEGRLPA